MRPTSADVRAHNTAAMGGVAALCLFCTMALARAMSWESCDGGAAIVVDAVAMEPDPPTHGQTMAFTVRGESKQPQVRLIHLPEAGLQDAACVRCPGAACRRSRAASCS